MSKIATPVLVETVEEVAVAVAADAPVAKTRKPRKPSGPRQVHPLSVFVRIRDEFGNQVNGAQIEVIGATKCINSAGFQAYLAMAKQAKADPSVVEFSVTPTAVDVVG